MKVAIRALKRRSPREIVVALPVAPPQTLTDLACEADWAVCLSEPSQFRTLGQHYLNFPQLSDADVLTNLNDAASVYAVDRYGDRATSGITKKRRETVAKR